MCVCPEENQSQTNTTLHWIKNNNDVNLLSLLFFFLYLQRFNIDYVIGEVWSQTWYHSIYPRWPPWQTCIVSLSFITPDLIQGAITFISVFYVQFVSYYWRYSIRIDINAEYNTLKRLRVGFRSLGEWSQ